MSHPPVPCPAVLPVRLSRFAASLFVLLFGFALAADAADPGRISGAVTSKITGSNLQGATVSLPGLGRTVSTDSAGYFLIQDVPAGEVELVARYTGFDAETQTVVVAAGAATTVNLELQSSDVVVMEAYNVAVQREGQALALTEQRNASNIKNVAAMDEWGILPNLSVGELAMRLPGVSYTVDEDNLINNVSIRGMGAGFTRLNIDGMSSTGVGGDGRSATLHSFSGAMYEQIEVVAGQTPDKRADSIGGQLNLKTRSPLAMKEDHRTNYNLGVRWAPPFAKRSELRAAHDVNPVGSVAYQQVFSVGGGHRNLGISLNASYTESVNEINYDQLLYQRTATAPAFMNDYTRFSGLNTRLIYGFSLRADYRISDRSTMSLRLLHNIGREPFYTRTRVNTWSNSTIATVGATGQLTGTGGIVPGFTNTLTEIRPVAGSRMDIETWRISFNSKNPTATLAFDHDFGRLKMDYAFRYSYTEWLSGAGANQDGGQLTLRTEPIGFTLDTSDLDGAVFKQTSGPSVTDVANFKSNILFTKRRSTRKTNEGSATFNATYNFETRVPLTLKVGGDVVSRRVDARQDGGRRFTRAPGAPALSGDLMALSEFEKQHALGARLPVLDPSSVNSQLSDPTLWRPDLEFAAIQPFTGRRLMDETVPAGYVQLQSKLKHLTVLGGVRVEDVELSTFTFARRKTTSIAVEPDPFKRAQSDFIGVNNSGSYQKVFPSVHFVYDLTDRLKARASYSTSYGRPTIAQLVPTISFNQAAQTLTAGNASLRPQFSENLDLKLEYYFKNNGAFTVGIFRKYISDFILNSTVGTVGSGPDNGFDGEFAGFLLTAPTNAGSAEATGLEFDFRQRLTFLPGPFKGLSVAANYTRLWTEGRFTGTAKLSTNQVPDFIPKAGNARLLYNYKNFGASVTANLKGTHIRSFSLTAPTGNFFQKSLTTVDLGVTYKVRPDATLFVNVNNLFEQGPELFTFTRDRVRQRIRGPLTINMGVSGQF